MITRREFLAESAGAVALAAAGQGVAQFKKTAGAGKFRYLGWQAGITYQSMLPGGLDRDYLMRLLDEMAANHMNLLSLMMLSYGYFDPQHDGYAWPVQQAKLECYADRTAINAQPGREFVRDIVAAAADRHIEVQLFLNWGIWNPDRIKASYPDAVLQQKKGETPRHWLHCPDSPGAWQLGLDEVSDLLSFYSHPNVTGYAFERVSYSGKASCYCPWTLKAFEEEAGIRFADAAPEQREAWKTERICKHLTAYTSHIKRIHPGISAGLHTQCAEGWGHDPQRLKSCGIDYLLPHTIQFPTKQHELCAMLERLAPNPCVLHFCCRDKRPENYKLWIKTPDIIAEVLGWVRDYPGDNIAGLLFFNEPATSPANKQAVYSGIGQFL